MGIAINVHRYLADRGIGYRVIRHRHTRSAANSARESHVPLERVAKAVVLRSDRGYVVAVLPASCRIHFRELGRYLPRPICLATENEAGAIFPDCALGAIPALGDAYGVEVIVDQRLDGQFDICFEGGDHASLVCVSAEQFRQLTANGRQGSFSRPRGPVEAVPAG